MSKPPAITQKAAFRGVICLFLLALLFAVYNYIRGWTDPDDFSVFDSKDMILAVQSRPNGAQVVIVKPDGTLLASPGYLEGKTDRDATWRPDGNTILFSSDREEAVYHIYRWNLMRNMVQRRSLGTRSFLGASFGKWTQGETDYTALITAGGIVQEFKAVDATTLQVLPPRGKGASVGGTGEESGTGSQFDAVYQDLGTSFRAATWGKEKQWVVAVMRREEGEVLILQDMIRPRPPIIVAAGDRIDFDVNPQSGVVVFTVQGARLANLSAIPKDKLKEAQQDLAHRHRIGFIDPESVSQDSLYAKPTYLPPSDSDKMSFGSPAVSPDGSTVIVVVGPYSVDGGIQPERLLGLSTTPGAGQSPWLIAEGQVADASWSPDGERVVYTRRVGRERAICTNSARGGNEKVLTTGKGDFAHPTFSPQVKKE